MAGPLALGHACRPVGLKHGRTTVRRGRLWRAGGGEPARPPDAPVQVERERGNQDRADDQRVKQHPEGHHEADLGEQHQRQDAEDREGGGEHDPGRGDHSAGDGEAAATFVAEDPFILNGVVKSYEIREWNEVLT